jgi:hypothetical protein
VDQKPIVGLSIVYHRVDEGKQKCAGGRGAIVRASRVRLSLMNVLLLKKLIT